MGYYILSIIIIIDYILIKLFDFSNPTDKIEISPNLHDIYKNKHNKLK